VVPENICHRVAGRLSTTAELFRVFKDLHQIVFEYQDGNGQLRKEELNNTELYEPRQSYTPGRGTLIPRAKRRQRQFTPIDRASGVVRCQSSRSSKPGMKNRENG
jgi:hypothetical protein